MEAFQTVTGLNMSELSLLIPALKLVAAGRIRRARREGASHAGRAATISDLIGSLRELSEAPWKELLEPLIVFERGTGGDPAGLRAHGFSEPRALSPHGGAFRRTLRLLGVGDCAAGSRPGARTRESILHADPRLAWRRSHVGYYLIGEGANELRARAGVRLPFGERVQEFLRRHPDEFYLGGIEILTLLIVIAIMTPVFNAFNTSWAASSRSFSCCCCRAARARWR